MVTTLPIFQTENIDNAGVFDFETLYCKHYHTNNSCNN